MAKPPDEQRVELLQDPFLFVRAHGRRLRWLRLGAVILAYVGAANAPALSEAQTRPDGEILALTPHAALPTYEALDEFGQRFFRKGEYEGARTQTDFDVLDLRYSSGGIEVSGILIRPKQLADRRWPAIVYNRGGTGDYSRLDHIAIVEMLLLAKAGFVLIASDYRFHGPTSRQDQWGGADLDDVLNVVLAVRSLPYVDPARLFMLGHSPGGTMTYLALKRGAPIRAAAVTSAASDLEAMGRYQPEFVNGSDTFDGWAKVWPDYASRATEHYRERSAVYWADKIRVPILIFASRTDRLVPADQALRMALALQAAGASYALQIYANDGRSLPLNRADRIQRIVEWFSQAP
jgi:dipeptidyl aminopeptidase/acylaminoacyl peptidase